MVLTNVNELKISITAPDKERFVPRARSMSTDSFLVTPWSFATMSWKILKHVF